MLFKQQWKYSTSRHIRQDWKTQSEYDLGKYYKVWCEIIPSWDNYRKFYRDTTKNIENFNGSKKDMLVLSKWLWRNNKSFNETQPVKYHYHEVKRNMELNACGIFVSSNVPININIRVLRITDKKPCNDIQNIHHPLPQNILIYLVAK